MSVGLFRNLTFADALMGSLPRFFNPGPGMHLKFIASFLFAMALLLAASQARAQVDAGTAESLMRSSGLWQQLEPLAPQVRSEFLAALEKAGAHPSPGEVQRLGQVITSAYAADRLRASALGVFTSELKAQHVPALKQWYASRVGKTIAGMEEAASADAADPRAVMEKGASLLTAATAQRRAALEELVIVTRVAEALVQITTDTAVAAQRGALSLNPEASEAALDNIKAELQALRPQWLQAFASLAIAGFAKAYDELPTDELVQYVDFLKTPAGQHFTDVGLRAYSTAMVAASTDMGRGLPGTKDKANT